MRAHVLQKPYRLEQVDITAPEITAPDDVLINIDKVGICGSDLLGYQGKMAFMSYPRILGHEFTGVVKDVGRGVTRIKRDEKVCVEPLVVCGKCEPCVRGEYNVCRDMKVLGVHVDGAMCEQMAVKEKRVYRLPENLSIEEGALIEPFCVALEAVRRTKLSIEDTLVVFGAGPIGLCILKAARAVGAEKVIVIDIDEARLELAKRMNADHVTQNYQEVIDFTGGRGADVIIEASGAKEAAQNMCEIAAYRGRIGILSFYKEPYINILSTEIIKKELDIFGSRLYQHRYPLALNLVSSGKVVLKDLITHRFAFNELENAIQTALNPDEKTMKIIIDVGKL